MINKFINRIFFFIVGKRRDIIYAFYGLWIILLFFWVYIAVTLYTPDKSFVSSYWLALSSGKVAMILYITTLIPGICRRFGFIHKLVTILMIFRRHIGITMYLFTFVHSSGMLFVHVLAGRRPLSTLVLFELAALTAFILLTALFVTSNDLSVKRFGIWWHRIHRFTYIILGLTFLHVILQRISVWSILLFILIIAEIGSYIASRIRMRRLYHDQSQRQ